jgi:hypothetical protein
MKETAMQRRQFNGMLSGMLSGTLGLSAASCTGMLSGSLSGSLCASPVEASAGARTTLPIGLSTYSLWRFKNDEFKDVGKCIILSLAVDFI